MKRTIRTLSAALLVSMPTLLPAAELRIYQMELSGKAPELASFCRALDEKTMPGLKVYTVPVQEDGKLELDLTRHDLPDPDPEAEVQRRVGVIINGELSPGGKDPGQWLINLKIRECKHSAYTFGEGANKFYPSLTESAVGLTGSMKSTIDTGKDAWLVIDTDLESNEARTVYVMQLTD